MEIVMNLKAMRSFLSESNIKEHLSYLRTLRLRLSIIEKSIPELKGASGEKIIRMNLKRGAKEEALNLHRRIRLHEIYFSSFTEVPKPSPILRKHYSSESGFVYEIKKCALGMDCGYIYVYKDQKGIPRFRSLLIPDDGIFRDKPVLSLDLFEHAYLFDYGFAFDRYLDGALSHIDLSVL